MDHVVKFNFCCLESSLKQLFFFFNWKKARDICISNFCRLQVHISSWLFFIGNFWQFSWSSNEAEIGSLLIVQEGNLILSMVSPKFWWRLIVRECETRRDKQPPALSMLCWLQMETSWHILEQWTPYYKEHNGTWVWKLDYCTFCSILTPITKISPPSWASFIWLVERLEHPGNRFQYMWH